MTMNDTLHQADQQQADQRKHQSASAANMRSSRFDLVTSFLTSMMIMLGSAVGIMFLMWVMSTSQVTLSEPSPISKISFATLGVPDAEPEFEPPTESEIESLAEPTLQDTITEISTIQVSGLIESDFTQRRDTRW